MPTLMHNIKLKLRTCFTHDASPSEALVTSSFVTSAISDEFFSLLSIPQTHRNSLISLEVFLLPKVPREKTTNSEARIVPVRTLGILWRRWGLWSSFVLNQPTGLSRSVWMIQTDRGFPIRSSVTYPLRPENEVLARDSGNGTWDLLPC